MNTSMLKNLLVGTGLIAASIGAISLPAEAGTIRSPISATATSEFSSVYSINNTINQSGLNLPFVSGVTDFDSYLAQNPTHSFVAAGLEWFTQNGVKSATLDYDLGSVFNVDRLALWNEETSGIGVFNVLTSTDGVSYVLRAAGLLPPDNPLANYGATVFGLQTAAARFVRLEVSGCPQPNPGGFNGCGMGEIAFSTNSTNSTNIPTPALLPGLIGMGIAAFRKRRQGQSELEVADAVEV